MIMAVRNSCLNSLKSIAMSTQAEESILLKTASYAAKQSACAIVLLQTVFVDYSMTGVSGPDNDRTIFPNSVWLFSGPEISGPDNDQIVWSLSGPGRCLVLLHRCPNVQRGSRLAERAARHFDGFNHVWTSGAHGLEFFCSLWMAVGQLQDGHGIQIGVRAIWFAWWSHLH